jgi:hypothetical protein
MIVVNVLFGFTSHSYVGAALKGSFTGLAGALLGVLADRLIPKRIGAVVFSTSLADIASVEKGRSGMVPTLEIAFKNGAVCTMSTNNSPEKWQQALLSASAAQNPNP